MPINYFANTIHDINIRVLLFWFTQPIKFTEPRTIICLRLPRKYQTIIYEIIISKSKYSAYKKGVRDL
jgi:hypothetical protein